MLDSNRHFWYHHFSVDVSAAVAQSVERRIGNAEVGGSIPLGSFYIEVWLSLARAPC